ncbi:MAG: alpha/beta hydrolase family esterase [Acidobacteriota bacterium]
MPRAGDALRSSCLLLLGLALSVNAFGRSELVVDLGRGPVTVHLPPSYDPGVATPLLVLLHGYGATGDVQELYMRFTPLADEFGFLYAHPDGSKDPLGLQFWNATDACCDFFGSGIDDSGYLLDLIEAIKGLANVDRDRVYLVGHSNGGYMSYRMACDHADTIAAIASLAGATWLDPASCSPSGPVHILEIHGTEDRLVRFMGGCTFPSTCYPGAIETVRQWAAFDRCDPFVDTSPAPINLDFRVPGDETRIARVDQGCLPSGSAELWVMQGVGHIPFLSRDFSRMVVEHLLAHPKGH